MRLSSALMIAIVTGVSAASITAANAQEQAADTAEAEVASSGDGDIVVTAQKRSESVQKVPLAITAIGGEALQERQITNLESLAPSLPSVNFGKQVGFARIAIRGLGLDASVGGQEGRVAYHIDGVYIGRPSAQLATFFDISRVEVVRGPQGTLYGRNATAGAINVITNDPTDSLGGYIKATVGNYGLFQEEGAIGGQVAEGISARFSFIKTDRSGYGENLTLGTEIDNEHSLGVRAKIKLEPSSSVSLVLSADYFFQEDAAFAIHLLPGLGNPAAPPRVVPLGGTTPPNPRNTFANVQQDDKRRNWGLGAVLTADIGNVTLTSVTGYRDSSADVRGDHDDTQVNLSTIRTFEESRQFSEEVRLDGEIGRLKWLVGAYYFNERIYAESKFTPVLTFSTAFLSRGLHFNGDLSTDAYAGFGQLDFEILDGLTVSAGLRHSSEKKSINQRSAIELFTPATPDFVPGYSAFQDASATFKSTTPRFNIQWEPTDNIMLYLTYSKGFKSGGFNLASIGPAVFPEKLTDYEGGFKATMLDGALRINGAAFYYDYKDLQVQRLLGVATQVVNAAAARVQGVEGEVTIRPVQGFEISGNATYLDAKFTEFLTGDSARTSLGVIDLAGNRLPQSSKFSANLAAQYTVDLDSANLRVRGEMAYTGQLFFSFYNRPEVSQDEYTKFNMSVSYEGDNGLTASLWMKNIGNRRTVSSSQVSSGFQGFPIQGTYDPPRTFGGSVGYRF